MRRDELKRASEVVVEEDETWADMRAGLCAFCQRPVSLKDGAVELAVVVDGRIGHPSQHPNDGEPIAYLTHYECGKDDGYWISLDRIDTDVLDREYGLLHHVQRKRWGDRWQFAYGLRIAAVVAEGLEVRRSGKTTSWRVKPSPTLRAKVFERDGFQCRRCAHGPPDVKLVLDHIEPVAKGGKNVLENLQTLCQPCNAGKSDRDPHERDRLQ